MKFNVQTTLIVGLCGLVAWQSWSLSDVNDRLTVIEASGEKMATAAKSTTSEPRGKRGRRANRQRGFEAQSPSASMRTETTSDAPAEIMPESEDVIRDVVSQQIEQRDAEKRQERIEKWTNRATERFQDQVSTIAEEYNVNAATQEQVVDALVDSMQQGFAIRKDVSSGELSYKDAKLEGAALKEDTAATVADMIGEDAAEALWDEMESEGGRY
tara:strand:- start:86 stop:727 length:642 start_codon:yes stop_codon:yes gene_type:complete